MEEERQKGWRSASIQGGQEKHESGSIQTAHGREEDGQQEVLVGTPVWNNKTHDR